MDLDGFDWTDISNFILCYEIPLEKFARKLCKLDFMIIDLEIDRGSVKSRSKV